VRRLERTPAHRPDVQRATATPVDASATVAGATAPTGQRVAVTSHRKRARAPIACVNDVAGRPPLCAANPAGSAALPRAGRSLER
jgi:hypothetical protein